MEGAGGAGSNRHLERVSRRITNMLLPRGICVTVATLSLY